MVVSNSSPAQEKDLKQRRMFVGIVWNCAAELKLLLTALLFLCSLATVLQFLPSRFFVSPSDLRNCLSTPTSKSDSNATLTPSLNFSSYNSSASEEHLAQQQHQINRDQLLKDGVLKRAFNPYGSAAYNFILMSAYRGGPDTFAVMGLSSKPLHLYGKPTYQCVWVPHRDPLKSISTAGQKILPDWGYGHVYTVVVVNCTFPTPAGADGEGGQLLVHASTNGGGDRTLNITDTILALDETPQHFANFTAQFTSRPRYRFAAKWMFFFDVDEFIFVPKKSTIKSVLDSLSEFTQFTFEQMPMSSKLCLSQDASTAFRKWGFEKLVYKDVKRGIRRDRKYAVQPKNVFATGVHMSQNTVGKTTYKTEGRIKYFHYHGTIAERREPCRQFFNSTEITVDGTPYVMDTTMREIAGVVKRFELKMIGSGLQRTRQ
ncbi:hypothetical protein DH2020_036839 [Rehmannia glutinosa]|uniref:Glycosyltransferase family 92 protein n=1 Tax=Rehmannia glutinosa TaxID=99300 RepID=A0ABR0V526_REHGL